jgi:hypothetical protein
MADHGASPGDDRPDHTEDGRRIIYRDITPDPDAAEYDLLEIIAEMEGVGMDELPSLYTEVDHFVETLFEDPPSPDAQMEIRFSYAGYRITITQGGRVKLVPVADSTGG